jgi:hypothetical protein
MTGALGWVLTVALAQPGSTPSAREAAAAFDPLQSPASVSVPRTSVLLEGGKDGKVLSGRIAVGLEKRLPGWALDLTLTGADFDESAGRSRVLQAFEHNPGGNLAVGLTWKSFDVWSYTPEIDQVMNLCGKRPTPPVSEEDKAKALKMDESYQRAQALADALKREAKGLEADAAKALAEPARQEEALTLQQAAWVVRSRERAATAIADEEKKRVLENVKPTIPRCAVKEDLTKEEQALMIRGFAPPSSILLMLRGDVGAQRTAYFNPQTGTRGSELKHPWGVRAGFGVFINPLSLVGFSVGYREAREARAPSQLCVNQKVGGETTEPPTLSCSSVIIGVPTWSGTARARLEWRQYLDALIPGAAWNPSVTWSTRIKEQAIRFEDVTWRLDVPVYFHLVNDKDKGLVVGAAYSRYSVDNEPIHDLSLFLSGAFSVAKL